MQRIQFEKGGQRAFIDEIIQKLNAPSLRSLLQYGIQTNYTNLKNYYTERRTLPLQLYSNLCTLAKIDPESNSHIKKEQHWGQQKGGRKSKRISKNMIPPRIEALHKAESCPW